MLTGVQTAGLAGEVLILNDTARQYHFGCFATSSALHNLLLDDGYSVATLPVTLTHALALPPTLAGLDPGAMRDAVQAAAPAVAAALDQADLVVVNGEGTLHGLNRAPRNLLGLMHAAKVAFGKRTYLVNHSLFPADKAQDLEAEPIATYRPALEGLDGIAAREPLSAGHYEALGLSAVPSFDLLPAFADRIGAVHPDEVRDPDLVVVGVGVNWPADRLRGFAETVRRSVPPSKRIVFLDGAPRREPLQERLFAELIEAGGTGIERAAIIGDRTRPDGVRARAWLRLIARAGLVVTGRYHHVVAAFAFGTPVVALRWMERAGVIDRLRVALPPLALFDAFCARLEPEDLAILFAIAPPRRNLVGLPRIERLMTGTRILLLLELSGVSEIGLFGTDLFVDTADPLWFGHDPAIDLMVIAALKRRLLARGGTFFWNEESAAVAALGQRRVAGGG
ncbi:polysaccharide pyruvyl transferase family protein [Prosthecomicrobium pneumaticum]|uniref:Polysaccharide pyruvyl transferase domain-containing protein n=1 Tax=Prosthecomicrobium pneumaticum TaxID=81895 RepID=A0A7W9L2X4_9HYPH|nr:hypothetical protein [Prosthecomicrobium pneumaticum]